MSKMDRTVSRLARWASSTMVENVLRVTRTVSTVVQDHKTTSDQPVATLAKKLLLKATTKWLGFIYSGVNLFNKMGYFDLH